MKNAFSFLSITTITLVLVINLPSESFSQKKSVTIGVEQDFLPYLTGGYYAAMWLGKSHLRGRALMAHVNKPSFIVPNGFTNNIVTAYALLGDYFLKEDFSGWHLGAGIVLWNSSIQSNLKIGTANYQNTMLNGSIGYNWYFAKRFYLCPWAGLHWRIGGAETVTVDGSSFNPPLFTPEASLKIGWYFTH